jgi:hypothetical protein
MLRRVALVRTDVSEERIISIVWVTIGDPIPDTLTMEAIRSSETSVLTTATWGNIPEAGIFHSQRRKNLKSCTALYVLHTVTNTNT